METADQIIKIAKDNGAALAGIAGVKELAQSPAHLIYLKMEKYAGVGTIQGDDKLPDDKLFNWPEAAKSILVIGLPHPKEQPELDWWDGKGTPGNRRLIFIMNRIREQIENDLNIGTFKAEYYVERGGVFLKDAAVLAGLGCIGRNNLLVTPSYGPRIRLRALFLDKEIEPTGPVTFDPCSDCKVYCRKVCPEKAMIKKASFLEQIDAALYLPARDGYYNRKICNIRMEKDIQESRETAGGKDAPVKYCRRCEFICPAGK